jgi:hypothetical protein
VKPIAGQLVCAAVIPLWSHGDPAVVFFQTTGRNAGDTIKKRVVGKV